MPHLPKLLVNKSTRPITILLKKNMIAAKEKMIKKIAFSF